MNPPRPLPSPPSPSSPVPASGFRRGLGGHLAALLVLKAVLLFLLWTCCIAPYRVHVDAPHMAERIAGAPANQSMRDTRHDRSDGR